MGQHKRGKICRLLVYVMLIVIASFAVTQSIQNVHAQTSGSLWGMTIQIQKVGQNSTSSTFAPFDPIQINANVTYNNASQPDILVYFNVTSPAGSPNQISMTMIGTTNSSGQTGCTLRMPINGENQSSIVGTWQVNATIETTNGPLQKSASFVTTWNMQIASLEIANAENQTQTTFAPGDQVNVQLSVNNTSPAQTANVTLNMMDQNGNIVNQTQILNSQIATTGNSSTTQIESSIQIPSNSSSGQLSISAGLYSGSFQGVAIPIAESQTVVFNVASNSTISPTPTPTNSTSPTASPSAGPSPAPNIVQNSVSLFSWLLVATGLFTFTVLVMFLRRKPTLQMGAQMPILASTKASPTISQSKLPSTTPQATAPQSTATAKIASDKTAQAAVVAPMPIFVESWTKKPTSDDVDKPETTEPQDQQKTLSSQLSRIADIGKRVQTLQEALNVERAQLSNEISELNKIIEAQEKEIKNYFDSIRQAVANIDPDSNSKQKPADQPKETSEEKQDD